jgi:MFS family permease
VSRRTPLWGFLAAQAVSISGTRLSMIAIPWFVLTSTGSATQTGVVAFAEMAPLVLLQFLAGPFIDRLGARRVALVCDWCSALVVGTIPLLHELGLLTFPALIGLVAVAGAFRGPGDAAHHAMLPLLVEHAHLPTERVTGLTGAVERTASLAGAALAGALVAAVGGADALVVDAGSFALSAVILGLTTRGLAPARKEPEADAHEVASSYARELRDGWSFMRRDPVLMGIGVMVAVTNLLDQAWSVVLVPVWAKESGYGVGAVGLLAATFGASAVVGSVLAAAWAERLPRYRVYLVCFIVGGVPRFVMLATDQPLWAILAVAVVGGCASGFLNPVLGAVLFDRTPPDLMGRVTSMNIAMSWSLIPFGGILGGLAVGATGLAPALLLVGAAYLVTTLAPAVQPRWKEMDVRPAREDADTTSARIPS